MDFQSGLLTASALAGFLLRTAVEWLAVGALVRVAGSAQLRFRLWLGMLLAFAAQWLWTLAGITGTLPALRRQQIMAASPLAPVPTQRGIPVSSGAASGLTKTVDVLFVLYCLVIAWQLSRAILERMRLAQALRHSRRPSLALARAFARAFGRRDLHCELDVLPGLTSPATVGWLRPRVLLPLVCEMQDELELEPIFWHELKHVERRDALWHGVARLCRALLWFHPAVHFAMRQMVAERELACDAAIVAEHPESCDVYASCLVRFARAVDLTDPSITISAMEMASRSTHLSMRVRAILTERRQMGLLALCVRTGTSAMIAAAMLAALPCLTILLYAERMPPVPALQSDSPLRLNPVTHQPHIDSAKSLAAKSPQPQITFASAAATPHDEALAAEHRVAMGVLTESTGMEGNRSEINGASAIDMQDADRSGHASGTWASVAIDAAERMGPLLVDHDSDDRH